jgi:RNA polymerase sigma factor (sigma-70 family)
MRSSWNGGEAQVSADGENVLALAVHDRRAGAFERLVERFERPLFSYVQRLLLDERDAQEVVQDAFLRAHRSLTRSYDRSRCAELAVRPWLFRIARNLALNKLRARSRHDHEIPLEPDGNGLDAAVSPGFEALRRLESRDELRRLDRAISSLPRQSRELVVLRFIEEMSYSEISDTVGGTDASLRGKVFRALKALRTCLETETEPEERSHAV